MTPPRKRGSRGISLYSNLSKKRNRKKDHRSRRKAEYLASLPKHPVKRFVYRAHPKRFFGYWFSREGGVMALKVAGVGAAIMVLSLGGLFLFYRQELAAIRPDELAKRVTTNVSTYYDRNGEVLWEDKGDGNYKLVVESKDISQHMKDATIAIEDKDFYSHPGVSVTGIARAAVNNATTDNVQGGSTLTQQLVKQVFFADEAQNRGLGGIPRKIKEVILAVEVERMYDKDQILTLYLNESPYGGRRNGVESAAQTYFNKSAKDLNIAESALLASVPQQPGYYDPYYAIQDPDAAEALIARQQRTIDNMAEQGFISKEEASEAQKIAVLDEVQPASDQFVGIKAPHFVQMVKAELEDELGKAVVGRGGLQITTTLDIRAQKIVDKAVDDLFASDLPVTAGFDNGAVTVIDSKTGQIIALRGSRSYDYPGFGSVNSATAYIQPGSSIKPLVFAGLFKEREGTNYGAGSILSDSPLPQSIYTTGDGTSVNNFDNRFRGSIPIRSSLAESRNIPAIKAMYINGRDATIDTIHDLGDKSYCKDGIDAQVGLAAAIGGCGLKQVEHVNAFATLARMGEYKEPASILEVKNSDNQTVIKWEDKGKQVIDPQIPYILSDILSDDSARQPSFGLGAAGLNVPGVKTATKTGTSNLGESSKDLWMMSYSPSISMGIWVGNNTPTPMNNALSSVVGPTVSAIMQPLHQDVYQSEGDWKPGDWFSRPKGVQSVSANGRTDLYPSWFSKDEVNSKQTITFDRVSKKKATDCTPAAARIDVEVEYVEDPVTKRVTYLSTEGYDASADDDKHKCDDVKPFVSNISANSNRITAMVDRGTFSLQTVDFYVDGRKVGSVNANNSGNYNIAYSKNGGGSANVKVVVTDSGYYSGEATQSVTYSGGGNGNND